MLIIQLGENFWVPLASSLPKLYKKEKEMKICVLCGERIEEWQLTDRTGEVHLECLIEEEEGCTDETGLFLSCVECWNPCSYRQALPYDLVRH